MRASPVWRDKEDLLASVPGVGPITARTLIAELAGKLGALSSKQIASLAGLAPFIRQSGQSKGKAMIAAAAKPFAPPSFLQASLPAVTTPSSGLSPAPRRRRKPKMLVAIAAARKLLTILNAILRDKQPWRPEST